MVADEAGLQLADQLDVAGSGKVGAKEDVATKEDPASQLEARLASLRG